MGMNLILLDSEVSLTQDLLLVEQKRLEKRIQELTTMLKEVKDAQTSIQQQVLKKMEADAGESSDWDRMSG